MLKFEEWINLSQTQKVPGQNDCPPPPPPPPHSPHPVSGPAAFFSASTDFYGHLRWAFPATTEKSLRRVLVLVCALRHTSHLKQGNGNGVSSLAGPESHVHLWPEDQSSNVISSPGTPGELWTGRPGVERCACVPHTRYPSIAPQSSSRQWQAEKAQFYF